MAEPFGWRCGYGCPEFCCGMPGWLKFCWNCACCGVSARDVASILGFCRGDEAAKLSSRGLGRFDGITGLVWYTGLGKEGEALRMGPFCMAIIC